LKMGLLPSVVIPGGRACRVSLNPSGYYLFHLQRF
jgi:hypothetical protein